MLDPSKIKDRVDPSQLRQIGDGFDEVNSPNSYSAKPTNITVSDGPLNAIESLWEPSLPIERRDKHNKAFHCVVVGLSSNNPSLAISGWQDLHVLGTANRLRTGDILAMVQLLTSKKLEFLYGHWDVSQEFIRWATEKVGSTVPHAACWNLVRSLEPRRCIEIWESTAKYLMEGATEEELSSYGSTFLANVAAHALLHDRTSFSETLPGLLDSLPAKLAGSLHYSPSLLPKLETEERSRCIAWMEQVIFAGRLWAAQKSGIDPNEALSIRINGWTKRKSGPSGLDTLWKEYLAAIEANGEVQWVTSITPPSPETEIDGFVRHLWGQTEENIKEDNLCRLPQLTIHPQIFQAFYMAFTQYRLSIKAEEVWNRIQRYKFDLVLSSWYTQLWSHAKLRNLRDIKIALVEMNKLGLKADAFCYALLAKTMMQESWGLRRHQPRVAKDLHNEALKYVHLILSSNKLRELEKDGRYHPIVFTSLLEGLLLIQEHEEIARVFAAAKDRCRGSCVELFNTVLRYESRARDPSGMIGTLEQMASQNIVPNNRTFAFLLRHVDQETLPLVIDTMRSMGLRVPVSNVIRNTISSLIAGESADCLEKASYLVSRVEGQFSPRDGSIIYTKLISGFAEALIKAPLPEQRKFLNGIVQCTERMMKNHFPITSATYNILLSALLERGSDDTINVAMQVFETFQKQNTGIAGPGVEMTYAIMLRKLESLGRDDLVKKVLYDLNSFGLVPTTIFLQNAIKKVNGIARFNF